MADIDDIIFDLYDSIKEYVDAKKLDLSKEDSIISQFLEHKDEILSNSSIPINTIELKLEHPLVLFRKETPSCNYIALNADTFNLLYKEFLSIRKKKKLLYAKIARQQSIPSTISTLSSLLKYIFTISNVKKEITYVQKPKVIRSGTRYIPSSSNTSHYILSEKQYYCFLCWYIQYYSYCFELMMHENPPTHIKFQFVKTIINYCILAPELSDSLDFGKKDFSSRVPDEIINSIDDYSNQYCYIIYLGTFLRFIYNKPYVLHAIKIGETHSDRGPCKRMQEHFNSKNFIDITVINIFNAASSTKMEDGLHKCADPFKFNKWLYNDKHEEKEIFGFRYAGDLIKILTAAKEMEKKQDHKSTIEDLTQQIEELKIQKETQEEELICHRKLMHSYKNVLTHLSNLLADKKISAAKSIIQDFLT